jgi:hypothetical protein
VGPLRLAKPLERIDIAPHRRFADRQRFGKLGQRRESPRLDDPAQFATTLFTHRDQGYCHLVPDNFHYMSDYWQKTGICK